MVFPGSQPTGHPSLQSCDTYTGDILPAIVPRHLTEMEKGFVLCLLLGAQSITVRQHGVVTQSMVVGTCIFFVSRLTRKQRKLEVEVALLLSKAHPCPTFCFYTSCSEVPEPPKTKPGAEGQMFKHVNLWGTFRIQTSWPSCNTKCIQYNL